MVPVSAPTLTASSVSFTAACIFPYTCKSVYIFKFKNIIKCCTFLCITKITATQTMNKLKEKGKHNSFKWPPKKIAIDTCTLLCQQKHLSYFNILCSACINHPLVLLQSINPGFGKTMLNQNLSWVNKRKWHGKDTLKEKGDKYFFLLEKKNQEREFNSCIISQLKLPKSTKDCS